MINDIEIVPISVDDYQFGYNIKKLTLGKYIEETYGEWNENIQIESYKKNFDLKNNYIIKYLYRNIGWLKYNEVESIINIFQIFILPDYQGKGIGGKIIQNIIEDGIKRKKEIQLQVLKTNTKAFRLYKKLGFIVYNETETHFLLKYKIEE